jgi:uncharacterized PurR-regulated membrane protein YhhQ (DUF165 family)
MTLRTKLLAAAALAAYVGTIVAANWAIQRYGLVPVGFGLSWLVADPKFAVASAAAFGLSELADFAVYTPLRKRGWLTAVIASNIVGLIVDSLLFLWLAFGSLDFLAGQLVGKAWMTALAVVLLAAGRYAYHARNAQVA